MSNNLPAKLVPEAVEKALMLGDLSALTVEQRVSYHGQVCELVGLNPLTNPFDFMKTKDGKIKLYANKNAGEQLRRIHRISINIVGREKVDSLYIVTARAMLPDGRQDESTGAVDLGYLKGEALANAIMKCETKAKRRVTLSIVGLGMLDESEVSDNPQVFTRIDVEGSPVTLPPGLVKTADQIQETNMDIAVDRENKDPERVEYALDPKDTRYNFSEWKNRLKKNGFRWEPVRKVWIGFNRFPELDALLQPAQSEEFEEDELPLSWNDIPAE